MYKLLIDNLAFVYSFVAKGRGKLTEADMKCISAGQHTLVEQAPNVLGCEDERASDKADLKECELMLCHIDELVVFQLANGEIV